MSSVPMDWAEFMSARHLMAEERVGTAQREHARREIAQVEATKAALRRQGPPVVLKPREPIQPIEPPVLEKGKQVRGKVA